MWRCLSLAAVEPAAWRQINSVEPLQPDRVEHTTGQRRVERADPIDNQRAVADSALSGRDAPSPRRKADCTLRIVQSGELPSDGQPSAPPSACFLDDSKNPPSPASRHREHAVRSASHRGSSSPPCLVAALVLPRGSSVVATTSFTAKTVTKNPAGGHRFYRIRKAS
jgi:hypothetical protein